MQVLRKLRGAAFECEAVRQEIAAVFYHIIINIIHKLQNHPHPHFPICHFLFPGHSLKNNVDRFLLLNK